MGEYRSVGFAWAWQLVVPVTLTNDKANPNAYIRQAAPQRAVRPQLLEQTDHLHLEHGFFALILRPIALALVVYGLDPNQINQRQQLNQWMIHRYHLLDPFRLFPNVRTLESTRLGSSFQVASCPHPQLIYRCPRLRSRSIMSRIRRSPMPKARPRTTESTPTR